MVWTFEEFKRWWIDRKDVRDKIINAGEVVSIDRINSDKHYCVENCRIIPNRLNGILGKINQLQGQLKKLYQKAKDMEHWVSL